MRVEFLGVVVLAVAACHPNRADDTAAERRAEAAHDSAFASTQSRGEMAMGVDQYTSTHVFEPSPDGGRIELQRDVPDSAGTAVIRVHMQTIATAFANGDFRIPGFVHAQTVPGTDVMAAKRALISYTVDTLPRGAALRIQTADSAAVQAVHEFLAFQRREHHAHSAP